MQSDQVERRSLLGKLWSGTKVKVRGWKSADRTVQLMFVRGVGYRLVDLRGMSRFRHGTVRTLLAHGKYFVAGKPLNIRVCSNGSTAPCGA